MIQQTTSSAIPPQRNVQYLNGRIPYIEKDTLPLAYISYQKADRINVQLNHLIESIQGMIVEVKSYSSSSKHLLENLKSRDDEESIKLRELHKRLLGGTLLKMVNCNLDAIDEKIKSLKSKLNGEFEDE